MRRIFTFSLGLTLALSATTLKAQLLINENFTGYNAGNLTGQGSWQTTNSSGSQIQVVAGSGSTGLYKAGYTSGTNYITIDNSGRDYYKNGLGSAPSILTAATFYYSFVVRVPSSAGTTTTGSASGVLGFRTGNGDLTATFLIGDANSNSNLKFGISTDNDNKTWASANYSFNTTYLVVIRYDAVPGPSNDKMSMWVDPLSLTSEAAMGTAAASITNGLGYSGNNVTISAIEFVQTINGAEAQFDGLKAAYGNGNATQAQDAAEAWSNFSPAGAPLPVKFQNLNARSINNSVSLNWNVASEEDLSGYSVERSNDGRNFSQIAFVNAKGESDYSFVDSKPASVSYYRIKSVDVNGRYGYSTVALVKSGSSSIVIKAFPSPVIKNVSIQHPTAVSGNSIIISSADGRVIKTIIPAAGEQQTDVDLSSAKAGLYVIRFNGANGESETLKILKQ